MEKNVHIAVGYIHRTQRTAPYAARLSRPVISMAQHFTSVHSASTYVKSADAHAALRKNSNASSKSKRNYERCQHNNLTNNLLIAPDIVKSKTNKVAFL
jgi:hypothetical protein